MAILLLERQAGLIHYTDAVVRRPDVQAMMGRVDFHVDDGAEQAGFDKMTSIIAVKLRDGTVIRGRAEYVRGSPAQPMSYDEVADKFRGCAGFARWPKERAEAVIAMVRALESAKDVAALGGSLAE